LRIGIDARAAAEVPAGRGRVVRELLRALNGLDRSHRHGSHRYVLYAREEWTEARLDERFEWRLLDARDPWWHMRAAHLANGECDVFLSSNSYLTSRFLRIPCVPIVYDLATFEPTMRPKRRSRVIERLTLGSAVRRSAKLLAISQATAEALIERYPGAASRTVVAPLGVSPALSAGNGDAATIPAPGLTPGPAPPTGAAPAPGNGAASAPGSGFDPAEVAAPPAPGFVLAVGTLEPRKNLPRLVAAYAEMPPELQAAHPLVVVGAMGWETNGTLQALRSLGERCTMLGYVSDAALAELYRRCAVFCYPSLGEGFGLPVLEAMAAGATVLTSDISSLPEVGGDAVAYADPTDVGAISGQLQALLRDDALRAELAARARARAARFSWGAFAETVLGALEEATPAPAAGGGTGGGTRSEAAVLSP
jgi:glycosyltransferase involved in cell wall biosynthesis